MDNNAENDMTDEETDKQTLSHLVVPLCKGPIYREKSPALWEEMLQQRHAISDFFAVLGVILFVDEAEGYAFVRQNEFDDDANPPPKLIQRRPLSFGASLLCLILRQWLLEHDTHSGESRAIITRRQIQDELLLYLPTAGSDAKQLDLVDQHIRRVDKLGLLKPLKDDDQRFEIQRITKALINAEWLGDLSNKLKEYQDYGAAQQ